MNTKTYEVKLKALKTAPEITLQLEVLKDNEKIHEIVKSINSDLRIKLTDEKYTMKRLYISKYYKATSLPTEEMDTSELTTMQSMFDGCRSITSLDLTGFDFNGVTDMSYMFSMCGALTEIKGVIDMKDCVSFESMFRNCSLLTGVKIKNPPAGFDGAGLNPDQYEIVS